MAGRSVWGSGSVSWHFRAERAASEILRRVRLLAQNDPAFVPRVDDASTILAMRRYALPPSVTPQRAVDDAEAVLAQRTLNRAGARPFVPPPVVIGAAAAGGTGGAATVAGTAGAAYTAAEQTIVNALVTQINANAVIINAQAAQITALAALVNTMRTALIANGTLS